MDGVNLPQLVDQFRGVTAAEEQTVVAGLANVSVADQPDRCSRGVKGRKDERAPATHRCSAARVSGIGRSNAAEWGGSEPVVRRVAAQSLTCGPPRPSLRVPDFCCACEGARRMGGKRKLAARDADWNLRVERRLRSDKSDDRAAAQRAGAMAVAVFHSGSFRSFCTRPADVADLTRSACARRYGSLDPGAQEGLHEAALEDEEKE